MNANDDRMPPPVVPLGISTLLPPPVRMELQQAALVDLGKPESPRRIAAINKATQHARVKYPNLFTKEK